MFASSTIIVLAIPTPRVWAEYSSIMLDLAGIEEKLRSMEFIPGLGLEYQRQMISGGRDR